MPRLCLPTLSLADNLYHLSFSHRPYVHISLRCRDAANEFRFEVVPLLPVLDNFVRRHLLSCGEHDTQVSRER